MPVSRLNCVAAMLVGLAPLGALAQAAAPASAPARPASAASVAPARPLAPAVAPSTVEPDRRATPQINIPLRKSASTPPQVGAGRAAPSATSGSTDDAVARCKAQASDDAAREQCR